MSDRGKGSFFYLVFLCSRGRRTEVKALSSTWCSSALGGVRPRQRLFLLPGFPLLWVVSDRGKGSFFYLVFLCSGWCQTEAKALSSTLCSSALGGVDRGKGSFFYLVFLCSGLCRTEAKALSSTWCSSALGGVDRGKGSFFYLVFLCSGLCRTEAKALSSTWCSSALGGVDRGKGSFFYLVFLCSRWYKQILQDRNLSWRLPFSMPPFSTARFSTAKRFRVCKKKKNTKLKKF